jgi:hypothetical protein
MLALAASIVNKEGAVVSKLSIVAFISVHVTIIQPEARFPGMKMIQNFEPD